MTPLKGFLTRTIRGGALPSLALALFAAAAQAQSFSTPKNLSNTTVNSFAPQIAVDPSGNINVVWGDDTPVAEIFFSRSSDGGATFFTPKNLSNNTGASFAPQIAVDPSGNINVVWGDNTPGSVDILFSRSTDGGATFSTPKNVSNNTGTSFAHRVAVDASGDINVVWEDDTPGNFDIFFSRSTDGGATFSAPKNLSNNTGFSFEPQIAVDASGNINVVWPDTTPGNVDTFFSRSSDGGATFTAPKNLSNNTGTSFAPQIAMDASGNINVVWKDDTPGNSEIFFNRSTDGGATFSTPKNLSNNTGFSSDPQVAVDSSSDINVVWEDDTPGNFDIFFSRSTDGGATFSTLENLSNNTGESFFPQIAMDASGDINVVWRDNTPGSLDIFFSRSTDGGATFSTAKNLSNNTGGSFDPLMTLDVSGNINVVWFDDTPGNFDIFFSRGVTLNSLQNDIAALPVTAFKDSAPGLRQAMLSILADGDTAGAISRLQNLLKHVGGCGASPDRNDWILDCAAQVKIQFSINLLIAGLGG